MPSTSPRSARSPTTPQAAPTTSPNKPKGRPAKKQCAASNHASAMPSTDGRAPTPTDNTNRVREGNQGRLFNPAWPANPEHRHFGTATPEPEHQPTTPSRPHAT